MCLQIAHDESHHAIFAGDVLDPMLAVMREHGDAEAWEGKLGLKIQW